MASIDEEEGCLTYGEVWSYAITGKYLGDVLVPVLVILTQFLACGFSVFVEYLQVTVALWMVWGRENTIDAKLLGVHHPLVDF